MKDENKTQAELIAELVELRQRNAVLEAADAECRTLHAGLRQKEQSLELALQGANLGIWDFNLQTNELIVNERAGETLGYASAEIGTCLDWWDERTHPDDLLRLRQAWQAHISGKTPFYECEYRLHNKTGEWKWILDRGKIVEWDQNHLPLRATGTHLDITERKHVEEALKKSEQRLELALHGADLGLWDVHLPSGAEVTNQRAAEMLGFHLDELEPHLSWWDGRTHPTDLPRLMAAWDAHLAGQTPFYESEYRLRTKSGEWLWILDRGKVVEWDQEGKPLRATGTHLDINERKQTEEALQKLNRELALLNNASQAFNSSLELDVVLVSLLEEVRPLLGVIGASVWLIDPETDELVCRQASGAHRTTLRGWRLPAGVGIVGWVVQHERSVIVPEVQKDSRHFKEVENLLALRLESILGVPLRSKEKIIGVLEVVDTQPHRFNKNEQMLVESLAATATIAIENARLYEQTRRDAETRAVLLQEVNHRTKNNLAAIIGLLHLEQRHDMSEEARTVYQTIMHDLISRIHGLATVHRLLSTADWSPILLSELATKVIHSALQALPLDKNVTVEVSPSPVKIAPKLANTVALIINELTTNTVKYAWPTRDLGCISVRIELVNEEVLVEFHDDGPGFPAEVLSLEHHSIGWELIQTLVQQGLQGKVSLHNDHGAVAIVRFPQLV